MDYSKWKKILIILSIISICFSLFSRVFGAEIPAFFTNTVSLAEKPLQFSLGSNQYGGVRQINLPSFVYDYKNVLVAMSVSRYNVNTKSGLIIFTNNKLFVKSDGTIYGEPSKDYYYKDFSLYSETGGNLSSLMLTDFSHTTSTNPRWGGYLSTDTNYNYSALCGLIYDYANQDDIVADFNPYKKPQFDNSDTEIQTLDFDKIFINPNDYGTTDTLYFKILEVTTVVENSQDVSQNIYYYNDLTFSLNNKSEYMHEFFDTNTFYYSIPYSALKLKKDKSYYFVLTNQKKQIIQTQGELVENDNIFDIVLCDTQNLITTQDEILNSIINDNPSDNTQDTINNNLPRPSYSEGDINIPRNEC